MGKFIAEDAHMKDGKETNYKWKPSENDCVFPKHKDGKIY